MMKYCSCHREDANKQVRLSSLARIVALIAILAVCCGLIGTSASASAPAAQKSDSSITAKCKADLAKRLKTQVGAINVAEVKDTTWPDAALGMPQIGRMYAQVMTPGSRIILDWRGSRYIYTTGGKAFRYGGPVAAWAYSLLYSMPVSNEANLNYDLYQCSLIGTNSRRVASAVSEFYPQDRGVVILKRRTSRSGHELLYVKADGSAKEKPLRSAFDFGDAAFNDAQDKWAGFVRPSLGDAWGIVVAGVGKDDATAQTLPLPDGVKTGQIAWSGENLMILTKNGERMAAYEISPSAAKPEWEGAAAHEFPGLADYMLNKSESLEINQTTVDGKPVVEVVRVWFTGDRNVVAKISGVTMRGYDFLGGRYALVWGDKGSEPVAYTVDIATDEVIPSASGIGRDVKPFSYPPRSSPVAPDSAR